MAEKKTAQTSKKSSGGGGGFSAPLQPDAALAAVIGSEPMPRTEVTKRIWDYIRTNNLQDPKDKRTIRADAKLKPVFDGKEAVSMFEMTKLVNNHLKK
ncbi:MAG TPA: SWIB/MDM2 domain-containing protein [Thermoanaerobaculia bacterium]|nr:SWIB/MDM2 domain-containing protein [Thermoanaerobaculia bacterium]